MCKMFRFHSLNGTVEMGLPQGLSDVALFTFQAGYTLLSVPFCALLMFSNTPGLCPLDVSSNPPHW